MTDANGSAEAGNPAAGADPAAGQGAPGEAQGFDWKATLGEHYAAHEQTLNAKGWKAPVDVLNSYVNLEKAFGSDKIVLPGKDAAPEAWDAVYAKLGRPEKPDGYELKKPEGLDGYDDEMALEFRALAHKNGLTAKQAAALHDWRVEAMQKLVQDAGQQRQRAEEQAVQEMDAAMEKEWGSAAPERMEYAKRAAAALGVDQATLDGLGRVAKNFGALKVLSMLGELTKEGDLKGEATKVEDAKAAIARLEADPNKMAALMDGNHPAHDEVQREKNALYARAYGG